MLVPVLGGQNLIVAVAVQASGARCQIHHFHKKQIIFHPAKLYHHHTMEVTIFHVPNYTRPSDIIISFSYMCNCTLGHLYIYTNIYHIVGGGQAQTQQSSTSRALTWIQCKLGKQYLEKKFTLPWESNPGPTPNRGELATLVASVGLKKFTCGHLPQIPSKVGFSWLSTIR